MLVLVLVLVLIDAIISGKEKIRGGLSCLWIELILNHMLVLVLHLLLLMSLFN